MSTESLHSPADLVTAESAAQLAAPLAMLDLTQGAVVTQALRVAAELRLADSLADGPLPAGELARRAGADPDAVHRLLRLLCAHGVFRESDRGYESTPLGDTLRTDAPFPMRDLALLMGHPTFWEDWAYLLESVRDGAPHLPVLRGMPAFDFMGANPEFGMAFGQGMGNLSALETTPVVDAYDFTGFTEIVDFCAGRGGLLAEILRRAPAARGVLVDARADQLGSAQLLAEHGLTDRARIDTAGLFDPVPAGGDAYVLKHIVHDWPEEQALHILRNVRTAIRPGGTLLLMEFVAPARPARHPSAVFDLWLLLLTGGRERTPDQYGRLLEQAGFALRRVVPTACPLSIVEATPR